MRKLIEDVVYESFTAGLNEIQVGTRGTALEAYLMPIEHLNWQEREKWLTDYRLRDIKKLLSTLNNEQLLLCLTAQHCEKFS